MLQVGKLDAANRQLDCAIDLFFSEGDLVCVHTLAGAASIILSNMIEHRDPNKSWDRMAQADNKLSPSAYFKIVRNTQNFLKHAQDDADKMLSFDEVETEHLMMFAVLHSGELQIMSWPQSVFQLWYLARNFDNLGLDYPFVKASLNLFPDIHLSAPVDQRALGLRVLRQQPTALVVC